MDSHQLLSKEKGWTRLPKGQRKLNRNQIPVGAIVLVSVISVAVLVPAVIRSKQDTAALVNTTDLLACRTQHLPSVSYELSTAPGRSLNGTIGLN